MNLRQIYEFCYMEGINEDPRGRKAVQEELKETRKKFKELKKEEKEEFDQESLKNPYSDTRILNGTGKEKVKTVMVGVDIEPAEVLLADRLKQKGKKIDAVMAHHPEGRALATLYSVMKIQEEIAHKFGVPINIAEGVMSERIAQVERGLSPINHFRSIDAARLLGIPLMCCHTPSDNHVVSFLQGFLEKKKPRTIEALLKDLKSIPEYKEAIKRGAGPKIFIGAPSNRCGKIYVDMTGGTEPAKKLYKELVKSGIGTVVGMHLSEEHKKEAEKNKFNYVVAGHISSDSIGLNLMLDKLEKKAKLNIIPCSGFTRVKRK